MLKVGQGLKAQEAHRVPKVHKEHKEQMVHKDQGVHKVLKVLSEHKGVLELKEIEDPRVHRVQIVSREE